MPVAANAGHHGRDHGSAAAASGRLAAPRRPARRSRYVRLTARRATSRRVPTSGVSMSRILVPSFHSATPDRGRRRFVQGLALGGAALGVGLLPRFALAAPAVAAYPSVLSGTEFDLTIGAMPVDFTGRTRNAIVVNRQLPAPILRWREGDTVTLRVRNTLPVASSIHWHGILLPSSMDGVPGLSFPGIAPGETFTYRFVVRQSGTFWYHSHSGFQEQQGLYGPIVIDARAGSGIRADRDHVVLLSDWTDQNPDTILATLKR